MANTQSAKKALRQSNKKRIHNLFWKKKIKSLTKTINLTLATKNENTDILSKEMTALQKAVDKAAKAQVIHKNKADRIKSTYVKRIAAQAKTPAKAKSKAKAR
jgi:small subunit ribosomal protein S20